MLLMATWTFLTNHALALPLIAEARGDPRGVAVRRAHRAWTSIRVAHEAGRCTFDDEMQRPDSGRGRRFPSRAGLRAQGG